MLGFKLVYARLSSVWFDSDGLQWQSKSLSVRKTAIKSYFLPCPPANHLNSESPRRGMRLMRLTKQCTWCPWFWSKALSIFQDLLWFVSWELHANFLSGFMAVNFCIYHFLKLCEYLGLKTGLTEISSMSLSLCENSLFQECKSNGFWDSKVLYLWWVIIFS